MIRTLESLFVVILVFATMSTVFNHSLLPAPIETSSIGLQELADSTLLTLDKEGYLTSAIFEKDPIQSDARWKSLINIVDTALPLGTVFKLTVSQINQDSITGNVTYTNLRSAGTASEGLPPGSVFTTYTITSPDVTVTQIPETITPSRAITLYILDLEKANGWWITGFDGHSLAQNVKDTLNPYFKLIVMVTSLDDYEKLLNGEKITTDPIENVQNAIVVNPFGEAVPIPRAGQQKYDQNRFTFTLGGIVNTYNWTWVSLVGYPFYYVTNTERYSSGQNGWGIYGMSQLGPSGYDGFLYGIDNPTADFGSITLSGSFRSQSIGVVDYTGEILKQQLYYGIFPGEKQTATRAFPISYLSSHNTKLGISCFNVPLASPSKVGSGGNWTNPNGAYSNSGTNSTSSAIGEKQVFYGYGLNVGSGDTINKVLIRLDAWGSTTSKQIKLEVSNNGGISWLPTTVTQKLGKLESQYWVDVTSWDTWTPTKVNGDNIRFRVTNLSSGGTVYLDWIPIEVTTSTSVYAGAIYDHIPSPGDKPQGSLIQLGLARTPDVRVMQILLLARYQPKILRTQFDAQGTTRLITLQIGQVGTN